MRDRELAGPAVAMAMHVASLRRTLVAEQVHTVPLVLQALSLRCILLPELPVKLAVARPLGTAVIRVHAIRRLAVEAVFLAEVLLHQG